MQRTDVPPARSLDTMPDAAPLKWDFFVGACLLTGAALLPHARALPVAGGMVLAGFLRWAWYHVERYRR